MDTDQTIVRSCMPSLLEALEDSLVVLLHGPRQCGKSTTSKELTAFQGYTYFSFDDPALLKSAKADPAGFVADLPNRAVLDEVQRVPTIFAPLKARVDARNVPGQVLLTGSANILFLPTLADSLAGRMSILRMYPFSQSELAGTTPRFLDTLFEGSFPTRTVERLGRDLITRIVSGGYPRALRRTQEYRRAAWYRDYSTSIIQRDARDIARIASVDVLHRLLVMTAGQTSSLVNISDLASPFQMSRTTIASYMTLLEQIFLVDRLPPWHVNQMNRLVKASKLHIVDTGVACALLGLNEETLWNDRTKVGPLLETFVVQELFKQASWRTDHIRFSHARDKDGVEVDLVLERGQHQVAGIEVKASATVTAADFRGLRKLKSLAGDRFVAGVVLYDGTACVGFGNNMYAVPVGMLWK